MYVSRDKMVISNEAFQEPVQLATPEPCLIFLRPISVHYQPGMPCLRYSSR